MTTTDAHDGVDEEYVPRHELSLDEWITWYSTDLMNMWRSLHTYLEDSVNTNNLLQEMTWPDFCEFCYKFSSKYASKYPS